MKGCDRSADGLKAGVYFLSAMIYWRPHLRRAVMARGSASQKRGVGTSMSGTRGGAGVPAL